MRIINYEKRLDLLEREIISIRNEQVKKAETANTGVEVLALAQETLRKFYSLADNIENDRRVRAAQVAVDRLKQFRPRKCNDCGGALNEVVIGENVMDKCEDCGLAWPV